MSSLPGEIRHLRVALLLTFFVKGAATASWASRIPAIQLSVGLSNSELGLVLIGLACGLIGALSVAGNLVLKHGSRTIAIVSVIAIACVLPLLGFMPSAFSLSVTLFCWGFIQSVMDVAINTQALDIQRRAGRPLMTSFHAAFSFGYFGGAGVGSLMIALGSSPAVHYLIVAPAFLALSLPMVWSLPHLDEGDTDDVRGPVFRLPSLAVLPFGIAAFAATFVESVVNDWSGLYMRDTVQAGAVFHPAGVVAFAACMAVGRLAGDALTTLLSARTVVRLGGIITTLGLVGVISFPSVGAVVAGCAAAGLGVGTVVPLSFSAVGTKTRLPSGVAIAGVATIGYAGFLVSPPIVGIVSQAVSLRAALAVVVCVASALIAMARWFPSTQTGKDRHNVKLT